LISPVPSVAYRPVLHATRVAPLAFALLLATRPAAAQSRSEDSVTVTVSDTPRLLQHSSQVSTGASTVLTRQDLSRAGDTAADVLRQVPGVQINRIGGTTDPATASIRGTDAKQVPVYLAGVRLNDEVNGAADLSTIPLWMMQQVELFRGNAPAFQTDLGLGGAVYFDPLVPSTKGSGEARLGLELHLGSFGRRGGAVSAQVGDSNSSALVSLRTSSIENNYPFLNDHGLRYSTRATEERRVNADATDVDGWAIGSHRIGRLRLNTIVNAFDREQGASGIAITPARSARARQRRLLTAVSGTYSCRTAWSCLVLAQASLLIGHETLTDPDHELRTLRADWQYSRGQRLGLNARAELGVTNALKITPLTALAVDTLELTTPNAPRREASRNTATLGAEASYRVLPPVTVVGMIRGACYHTEGEFIDLSRLRANRVSHCPATPDGRVGVNYEFTDTVHLLANLGHTWREPTLGERYGVSAALDGEPLLKPERTYNVDVGTRGHLTIGSIGLAWDAFVYRRASDDLVRYRRTSLYAFSPYNVGSTVITGAELTLATQLPLGFATQSTFTMADPRDTTPGRRGPNDILPMTSRFTTFQELRWTRRVDGKLLRQATLGARYYHRSNRYADPAGVIVLPAVQSVDAHADATFATPELGVSLALNNLLNQQTLDYLGLPVPGRSYHVSMTCLW
jgi:vitamin B12 transporter